MGQVSIKDFETVLPGVEVRPGGPELAVDGREPVAAVFPTTREEVSAVLKLAWDRDLAVSPRGGGVYTHLGNPPRRLDLVVATTGLNRVVEYEPADLTAVLEAGLTLARVQEVLGRNNQFLPLDPPRPDRATIGGILAANQSGPLRLGYGTARDIVIGTKAVLADGTLIKSGGKVVKNVAGYDLNKLFIGSLGTVGIIVEAAFKVYPKPQAWGTAVGRFAGADAAWEAVWRLRASVFEPVSLELLSGSLGSGLTVEGWHLYARYAGYGPAVERQVRETCAIFAAAGGEAGGLPDAEETFWPVVRDLPVSWQPESGAGAVVRAGMLPTRLPEFLAAATADLGGRGVRWGWVVRAGVGLAYGYLEAPANDTLAAASAAAREVARKLGGYLVVERAGPDLKAAVDVWGPLGPELELMRRLKAEFDPKGILNPGRFVGGI